MNSKKILDVRYISQYQKTIDSEWQNRSCGIVCVAMLIDYYNSSNSDIMSLIDEGVMIGGYSEKGWSHESLVRLLRNKGINSYAQEFRSVKVSVIDKEFDKSFFQEKMENAGLNKIFKEIDKGNPVIVSVSPNFNENIDNHLVLIVGYDFSNEQKNLIIHDPNGKKAEHASFNMIVDLDKFKTFWRKFAIFSYSDDLKRLV